MIKVFTFLDFVKKKKGFYLRCEQAPNLTLFVGPMCLHSLFKTNERREVEWIKVDYRNMYSPTVKGPATNVVNRDGNVKAVFETYEEKDCSKLQKNKS